MKEQGIIYFDNNATTQVLPSVLETMLPFLKECYGNPSSSYPLGTQAAVALNQARKNIATLLECEPYQITFTSSGTEANNMAIASALEITGKRHIVTSGVEHSSIRKHCAILEKKGFSITRVPVRQDGTLDSAEVEKAIRPETALVTLMCANNETGVQFPVEEISAICQKKNLLFHTDAVQVVGKTPVHLNKIKVDYLSLAGHKFHAPKGVGALYIRERANAVPYILGSQERGFRGGTENVASIVALGAAAKIAREEMDSHISHVRALRDRFEAGVLAAVPEARVNGHTTLRMYNTSNIYFGGLESEAILLALAQRGLCASAGSACSSGSTDPSPVLSAMGLGPRVGLGSVRFSFCYLNTKEEVERGIQLVTEVIQFLRQETP